MASTRVDYIQQLIFGDPRSPRYTQDSPILPDVWLAYCAEPGAAQKLLLTPHFAASAGGISVELREDWQARFAPTKSKAANSKRGADSSAVATEAGTETIPRPRIAYNQMTVALTATFEQLVYLILPRTTWWQKTVIPRLEDYKKFIAEAEKLAESLQEFHRGERTSDARGDGTSLWMASLVGAIAWAQTQPPPPRASEDGDEDDDKTRDDEGLVGKGDGPKALLWQIHRWLKRRADDEERFVPPSVLPKELYVEFVEALGRVAEHWQCRDAYDDSETLWLVNLDRPVETAQLASVRSIKADSARLLFEIDCSDISWAVIDSGIDASHPAFQLEAEPEEEEPTWPRTTRVKATYDFSRVRLLLDFDWVEAVSDAAKQRKRKSSSKEAKDPFERFPNDEAERGRSLAKALARNKALFRELEDLRLHLLRGRQIDWDVLKNFLNVTHDADYEVPTSGHGTHVAGILGARAVEATKSHEGGQAGICPDINLYDLRVIDSEGGGDEFYVISALQFVRHLNSHQDYQVVHGANLSLSIRHEVRSFACGATPVCEEAERLMASGVVVVTAAGNRGYQVFELADNRRLEGFLAISITDPGNAEKVITVGATHRSSPHTYGVSYFSSRGPTGDGRSKPDLVAPGEKILAPVPNMRWDYKDGTSMAAPHVSGAAAMVLARHSELQGKPDRVKAILCSSATDLGREKYFQGHGLVDVLRALQSV